MKKNRLVFLGTVTFAAIAIIAVIMFVSSPADNPESPTRGGSTPSSTTLTEMIQLGDPYDEENAFLSDTFEYTPGDLPKEFQKSDFDGDGLQNIDEIANGTDMYKYDTDSDGIGDGDEINKTKTDPLKWSSRDDSISDLAYWLTREENFKAGWSAKDASGFVVSIEKPEDRLWIIRRAHTNAFDELETVSEAYQIDNYSGTVALDLSRFIDEVAQSIDVYKIDKNGMALKSQCAVDGGYLMFPVEDDDIFVLVYSGEGNV